MIHSARLEQEQRATHEVSAQLLHARWAKKERTHPANPSDPPHSLVPNVGDTSGWWSRGHHIGRGEVALLT